jgi:hypothetical protein
MAFFYSPLNDHRRLLIWYILLKAYTVYSVPSGCDVVTFRRFSQRYYYMNSAGKIRAAELLLSPLLSTAGSNKTSPDTLRANKSSSLKVPWSRGQIVDFEISGTLKESCPRL